MAIVVEDGTIVAGANSYVSEAELTTYATDRGITLSGGTEALLLKAMDYLETLDFIGDKSTADQPLQWPRTDVYIDGYYVDAETIPQDLKNAEMALAISIDGGADPMATIERATKREKADVLEVEYMDNASTVAIITSVNRLLRKLLKMGTGGGSYRVVRI